MLIKCLLKCKDCALAHFQDAPCQLLTWNMYTHLYSLHLSMGQCIHLPLSPQRFSSLVIPPTNKGNLALPWFPNVPFAFHDLMEQTLPTQSGFTCSCDRKRTAFFLWM